MKICPHCGQEFAGESIRRLRHDLDYAFTRALLRLAFDVPDDIELDFVLGKLSMGAESLPERMARTAKTVPYRIPAAWSQPRRRPW
jgi:hypothetical protein